MQNLQSLLVYIYSNPHIIYFYGMLVGLVMGFFLFDFIHNRKEGREYVKFLEARRKHEKHLVDLLAESDAHSANKD